MMDKEPLGRAAVPWSWVTQGSQDDEMMARINSSAVKRDKLESLVRKWMLDAP